MTNYMAIIRIMSILLIIMTLSGCKPDGTYPHGGIDSIADFGDGRFHVMTMRSVDNIHNVWSLDDFKDGTSIDEITYIYREAKEYVYIIGSRGYTKLNTKTGDYQQSLDLADFDDIDAKVFSELNEETDAFIKKYNLVYIVTNYK